MDIYFDKNKERIKERYILKGSDGMYYGTQLYYGKVCIVMNGVRGYLNQLALPIDDGFFLPEFKVVYRGKKSTERKL